ncbi:MAG: hypothetical protein ACI3XR_05690 [Eubacteriales bacterium]
MQHDVSDLRNLDDEQFRQMVRMAAGAMGLSPDQVENLISNTPALKTMLAGASDSDLQKLANRIGKDRTEEILSKLQK